VLDWHDASQCRFPTTTRNPVEEVRFYADGDYAARKAWEIGLHHAEPRAGSAGPQPGAVEKCWAKQTNETIEVMLGNVRNGQNEDGLARR